MAKDIVMHGELLGIEEEFFGNEKTFAEDGNVYSTVMGEKKLLNRQLQVYAPKFVRMLRPGDAVIGRVEDLYDSVSLIVVQSADGLGGATGAHFEGPQAPVAANSVINEGKSRGGNERKAIGKTYCYMRITELVRGGGYVKNFRQYIKIGDILKAKVIDVTPLGTYLTIAEDGLGVLKSLCSQCHSVLSQKGRMLMCDECGNKESRKLANLG